MGPGWWLTDAEFVVEQTGGAALIQHAMGTGTWFTDSHIASPTDSPEGSFLKMNTENGAYVVLDQYGNRSVFAHTDNTGSETRYLLSSRSDANGNETVYTYGAVVASDTYDPHALSQIVDPFGRQSSFVYANHMLSTVTDFAGRTTSYFYDGNGNLSSVELPAVQDEYGTPSSHPTVILGYDGALLTSYTNERGETQSFDYAYGSTLWQTTHYDGSVTTSNAFVTGGLLEPGEGQTPATAVDAVEVGTYITTRTSQRGYETDVTMNKKGMKLSETDPLGNQFKWTRDGDFGGEDVFATSFEYPMEVMGELETVTTSYRYADDTSQMTRLIHPGAQDDQDYSVQQHRSDDFSHR